MPLYIYQGRGISADTVPGLQLFGFSFPIKRALKLTGSPIYMFCIFRFSKVRAKHIRTHVCSLCRVTDLLQVMPEYADESAKGTGLTNMAQSTCAFN